MAEDTGIEKLTAFLNRNAYPVMHTSTSATSPHYGYPRIVIIIPPRLHHRVLKEVEELKTLLNTYGGPLGDEVEILLQYAPGYDASIIITHLTDATMWPTP